MCLTSGNFAGVDDQGGRLGVVGCEYVALFPALTVLEVVLTGAHGHGR
jgi:hypothetical protein